MYIIGNLSSDNEIPKIIEEVKRDITELGGSVLKHEDLGKKRLSYPIKKVRNANYILVRFEAEPSGAKELEKKMRANQEVIRYLILNIEDALRRTEKDRLVRSKMKPRTEPDTGRPQAGKAKPAAAKRPAAKKIEIDLDAEIEKALETDELK